MADIQAPSDEIAKEQAESSSGEEFVMMGRAYVTRDEKGRRVIHRRGSKVRLDEEQVQRLRAGQPGSVFQREIDLEEPADLIEVAVANEASKDPEDGSEHVTVVSNSPRRIKPSTLPEREDKPVDKAREGEVAAPVTSTRKPPRSASS